MEKSTAILNGIVEKHTEKLKHWYDLLVEIMPDYFFQTFTPSQIQEILPLLFNIESNKGIEQIIKGNNVIFVYLKSEAANLSVTSRMMRAYNVSGAVIHESKQKLIIDGHPKSLVIEYYNTADESVVSPEPVYSRKEVLAEFKKRYKNKISEAEVNGIYERVAWHSVKDLTLDRLVDRLYRGVYMQDKDWMDAVVDKVGKNELRLTLTRTNMCRKNLYFKMVDTLWQNGFHIQRAYFRELTLPPQRDDDFAHMPVLVNTLYLTSDAEHPVNQSKIEKLLWDLRHTNWVTMDDLIHREFVVVKNWDIADANFIRAATEFIHSQLSFVDRNAYNEDDITRWVVLHEDLAQDFLAYFQHFFSLKSGKRDDKKAAIIEGRILKRIQSINTGMREMDQQVKTVMRSFLNFVQHIQKTNFYVPEKTALSFRLDSAFMKFYEELSENYAASFPKDRPYGVFYFYGEDKIGFQIRFSKIARGGWRTVIPKQRGHELERMDSYAFAKDELFREVYVLAHTQHLKNKDIYEGGSKMIALLNISDRSYFPFMFESQRSLCQAFLDLIVYDESGRLRNPNVVDRLEELEIIELGPDENMTDVMISWISSYAEKVGYTLGAGFMSGKPDRGINHKEYGVTSYGVHQYLLKVLNALKINPLTDPFSVKISGGPMGDVAGNEMNLLLKKNRGVFEYPNLKIVAITDGPAAAYDPAGLDREELLRLVLKQNLDKFNPEKLRGEGAYIVFSETTLDKGLEKNRLVARKGGKITERWITRDEYMGVFQNNVIAPYADIFIPCGGRPATIDMSNWRNFCPEGKPSARAIVEGANSFITPDARNALQESGVWIIKDASANKCGVMTSSYEIISGLILSPDEFCDKKEELVKGIFQILKNSADQEAEWLLSRFMAGEGKLTDLTERLSRHVNQKNEEVLAYLKRHPEMVKNSIILKHLPAVFKSVDVKRLEHLPAGYREAIVSVELAKSIVYSQTGNIADEIKAVLR